MEVYADLISSSLLLPSHSTDAGWLLVASQKSFDISALFEFLHTRFKRPVEVSNTVAKMSDRSRSENELDDVPVSGSDDSSGRSSTDVRRRSAGEDVESRGRPTIEAGPYYKQDNIGVNISRLFVALLSRPSPFYLRAVRKKWAGQTLISESD